MIDFLIQWFVCRVLTTQILLPFVVAIVGPQLMKFRYPVTFFGIKYTITSSAVIVFVIPYFFGINSCSVG